MNDRAAPARRNASRRSRCRPSRALIALGAVLAGCAVGGPATPAPSDVVPVDVAGDASEADRLGSVGSVTVVRDDDGPPEHPFRIVAVELGDAALTRPTVAPDDAGAATGREGRAGPGFEEIAHGGGEVSTVVAVGDDLLIGLGAQLVRVRPDVAGAFDVVARSPRLPGIVLAIHVEDDLAYVGTSRGLVVLSLGEGGALPVVDALAGPPVYRLAKVDHRLVVVLGDANRRLGAIDDAQAEIVDASNPAELRVIARLDGPKDDRYHVDSVAAAGSRAFLVPLTHGLVVLDFSAPGLPRVESVGLTIRDASGNGREVSYVGSGGDHVVVVDYPLDDALGTHCAHAVDGLERHGIRTHSVGCFPGEVVWMAVDDAHVWTLSRPRGEMRIARHALDAQRGAARDVVGEVAPPTVLDWNMVLREGVPNALLGQLEAGALSWHVLTPLIADVGAPIDDVPGRPVHLADSLGVVTDVDACGGRRYALGAIDSLREGGARWVSRLAPLGVAQGAEQLGIASITPIESFVDGPASSQGGVPAEQIACSEELLAVIGTTQWGNPKVRLGLYDVGDGGRGQRMGIAEQSAEHCFQDNGLPHANRCGPTWAIDLRWDGDVIRADYNLDGPQWFDVANPRQPERLETPPASASSEPRSGSGGYFYPSSAVVAHAGYEYVIHPSHDGYAIPDEHSFLAVHDLAAGPDADAIFEMPLSTPYEVEAALLEVGGRAFLLASSRAPGLHVIALDDPTAPVPVGHIDLPQPAEAIAVAGDLVHVAVGRAGLVVFRARVE